MRVLARLYRRLFLERLEAAFTTGRLRFFGNLARFGDPAVFAEANEFLVVVFPIVSFGQAVCIEQNA